jgi:hypothetical protein
MEESSGVVQCACVWHLNYSSQPLHVSLQRVEPLHKKLLEKLEALAVNAAHHLHTQRERMVS